MTLFEKLLIMRLNEHPELRDSWPGGHEWFFGLRLEPSIIEFGPRMNDILQIEIFPFKLWKNLFKNLKNNKIQIQCVR